MKTQSLQPYRPLSSNDLKQTPLVSSDSLEAAPFAQRGMSKVTRHNVLQLQRLIGNQGVQRLMPVRQAVDPPSHPIQRSKKDDPTREDKGLIEEDAPERFVGKVQAFTDDPQNANANIGALQDVMKTGLNDELTRTGVPVVEMNFMASHDNDGSFSNLSWTIELGASNLFGDSTQIGLLTQDQIEHAVETVYHEGRHAEQFFRIAQLHVADLMKEGVQPDEIKSDLVSQLDLPEKIIEAAIANPLNHNTNREIVRDIKLWDRSRFGIDKSYRDLVMYGMRRDALKPLEDSIKAFQALILEQHGEIPEDQQEVLRMAMALVDEQQEHLEHYQKTTLRAELERVQAVDNPKLKTYNATMIQHLTKLLTLVNGLRAYRPLPSEPYAAAVMTYDIGTGITEIYDELRSAYKDLPQEEDAFDAEEDLYDHPSESEGG
jgi:hypothetical protein